jgi:serine/threonine protein kinase
MTRYTTGEMLGQGGTGQVLAATDAQTGQSIALKRIHQQMADDAGVQSELGYEARTASALEHPNIVRVHEVGTDEIGLFVAMERVGEGSLADRIENGGALAPIEAIPIIQQAGRALAAAHQAGLRHGNLKPSNILLAENRVPKLTDFGSGRLVLQDELTRSLAGEDYLAPELLGENPLGRLDARSDVYGLAACLYAALTGENPRSGAAWRVPPHLRQVLSKALSENPDDRQRHVDVFLQELTQASGRGAKKGKGLAMVTRVSMALLVAVGVGFFVFMASDDQSQAVIVQQDKPADVQAVQVPDKPKPPLPKPEPVDRAMDSAVVATAAKPKAALEELNVVRTLTRNGYALGYVQNAGNVPIEKPRVDLEFFDGSDKSLGTAFGYASFDLLEPGERSPIKVLIKPYPEGFVRYESKLTVRAPYVKEKRLAKLAVVGKDLAKQGYGSSLEAKVQVRNDDKLALKFVEAIVVLYDDKEQVVEIGSGYVKPKPMKPGATGEAKVLLLPKGKRPPSRWQVYLDATVYPSDLR